MRLHVSFLSALILAICLTSATAQSSSAPAPKFEPCGFAYGTVCGGFPHGTLGHTEAPPPILNLTVLTPHDSRTQLPSLVQKTAQQQSAQQPLMAKILPQDKVNILGNKSVCYTMRTYNFSKDPTADMIRPVSYSTCESAHDTHLKGAAASAVLVR